MERLAAHDTLYLWWLGLPAEPVAFLHDVGLVPLARQAAGGRHARKPAADHNHVPVGHWRSGLKCRRPRRGGGEGSSYRA